MEPHYLLLVLLKELSQNVRDMEIYEFINSNILISWTDTEIETKVMVSCKP